MPEPARIAFVLAGAASLGSFQAGSLAALIEGLRPLCRPGTGGEPPPLAVDVMTGASSGAINSLLGAHCLVQGRDAVAVLRRAWVEQASLGALHNHGVDAPLSLDGLGRATAEFLAARPEESERVRVAGAVDVEVALTSLRGFTEPVGDGLHVEPSYRGRHRVRVHDAMDDGEIGDAVRYALASAANPIAFAPRFLAADGDDPGIVPGWYTDGGLLDNTLGRALQLANERRHGAPEDRMLVVVQPFTSRLPPDPGWHDPGVAPSWSATILRCLDVQQGQLFTGDVEQVHAVNERVARLDEMRAALGALDPAALAPVLAALGRPGDTPDPAGDLVAEIARRTGVETKQHVHFAMISPDLLAEGATLAGDLLAGFGGFASDVLRARDFDLGYRCALTWFEQDPLRVFPALSPEDRERARRHAVDAYDPARPGKATAGSAVRAVGLRGAGHLVRIGLRTAAVLARDAVLGARLSQTPPRP